MKKFLIRFSLLGLISLFLFSAANAQVKRTNAKDVEPTAKEAIRQVLLNGNILLSAAKDCASVKTSAEDRTILDFLSGVLSFQAEPSTKNSIEFSFKREIEKPNDVVWICDVLFRGGDEESPAGNGVRFKMRNADRRLMRESLECIGTG